MRSRMLLALAAALAASVALPARAAPDAAVEGVWRAGSCEGRCGASAPEVDQGDVVSGTLQVAVSASSLRALEWARLEARFGADPRWICLQHWTIQAGISHDGYYDWASSGWPDPAKDESSCLENAEHLHGELTANATYRLRVVARERTAPGQSTTEATGFSDTFELRLNNPPSRPEWAADPTVSNRTVTLTWRANPEPDVLEYRIERDGPGGETSFAVPAQQPESRGCSQAGGTYSCIDAGFGADGGTFAYRVVALRRATGGKGRCELMSGSCIASAHSAAKEAAVPPSVGTPTQGPAPTIGPSPVPGGFPTTFPTTFPTAFPSAFPTFPAQSPPPSGTGDVAAPPGPAEPLPGSSPAGVVGVVGGLGLGGWLIRRSMVARR